LATCSPYDLGRTQPATAISAAAFATSRSSANNQRKWFDGYVPDWLIWIIAAAVLAGAEALSVDLVLVMLAGGAVVGAGAAAIGLPPLLQVLLAAATSIVLIVGVRPVARKHLMGHGGTPTNAAALIGKEAVVLTPVDFRSGLVRLNGGDWSARSAERHHAFGVGDTVQVVAIDGATAVVWYGPPS
jgi:membrane protein implicated in regulation of membrane protease activity